MGQTGTMGKSSRLHPVIPAVPLAHATRAMPGWRATAVGSGAASDPPASWSMIRRRASCCSTAPPGATTAEPGASRGALHQGEDAVTGALREAHEEAAVPNRTSRCSSRPYLTSATGPTPPWLCGCWSRSNRPSATRRASNCLDSRRGGGRHQPASRLCRLLAGAARQAAGPPAATAPWRTLSAGRRAWGH